MTKYRGRHLAGAASAKDDVEVSLPWSTMRCCSVVAVITVFENERLGFNFLYIFVTVNIFHTFAMFCNDLRSFSCHPIR